MARGKMIKVNKNSKGIQEIPKGLERAHGSASKLVSNMKLKPSQRNPIFKPLDDVWPNL